MALRQQALSLFFGATDQDTSAKGIKLGDLVRAVNMQQLHGGEFIKRGGFSQEATTDWNPSTGTQAPDSVASPDGIQTVVRNTKDDTVSLVRAGGVRDSLGGNLRLMSTMRVLFPAGAEGEQIAPMAKQAGQYYVWLKDSSTFRVAKLSSDGQTLEETTIEIAVNGPASVGSASTHVTSFAIVDDSTFDSANLWIYWADWTTNSSQQNRDAIWAIKVSHSLATATQYQIYEGTQTNDCVTSIAAGRIPNNQASAEVLVVAGVCRGNAQNNDYAHFCDFRKATTDVYVHCLNVWATSAGAGRAPVKSYVMHTNGLATWVSGCCLLTIPSVYSYVTGKAYFAVMASNVTYPTTMVSVFAVEVDTTNSTTSVVDLGALRINETTSTIGSPCIVGQLTGHETATGFRIAAQLRAYAYLSSGEVSDPAVDGNAGGTPPADSRAVDRLYVKCGDYLRAGSGAFIWEARGAWLAQGWFTDVDGNELLITGYEDPTGLQVPYHLRRFDTGAIVGQFATGQGPHVGGCASKHAQLEGHCSDIQQPSFGSSGLSRNQVLLSLQGQNISGSADIAQVTFARPAFQNPATWRDYVVYPGPIPTICQGMQPVREVGPLTFPADFGTFGSSGAYHADIDLRLPITDGDTAAAIVYRLVDSMGSVSWSTPMLKSNVLRMDSKLQGSPLTTGWQHMRIPTLRHLLPGTVAQIEVYIGQTALELFRVLENDPTTDYIDFSPDGAYSPAVGTMTILSAAIEARAAEGPMPVIYTNGNALANDPPPQARCLTIWRNRCIVCDGNSVWPSLEFEDGIGIRWNNTTRIAWNEGTGPILAVCAIDWNYLAVFKEDAIGVISGPGPDGMGHGNYIVQTLLTKRGCNNPKSVVNGADGCYFQDRATGRLAIVTPQLQVVELAPGWFNSDGALITCAMQVEARQQVWLATNAGQVIALDYKHKTERCPFGQAFVWSLPSAFGNIAGLCIVGGIPRVVYQSDGRIGDYLEGQAYDVAKNRANSAILMTLKTGHWNPVGLQRQIDVCKVQFLGEYVAPHSLTLTVYPDYATTADAATAQVIEGPENFVACPPDCQRIHAVAFEAIEGVADGEASFGTGFKFVGFGVVFQDWGKLVDMDMERIL